MMASPFNEQPTESESFQIKANQITDASLESTRNMVRMCEDTQDIGSKTITALDEQGDKLDRIEHGLDNIHADLKRADKHLKGMEKWFGSFSCPWGRRPKVDEVDAKWEGVSGKTDGAAERQPREVVLGGEAPKGNQGYIERITNDAREDEMDENLGMVANMVGNMKNMAIDMGDEISKQNEKLERTRNNKKRIV